MTELLWIIVFFGTLAILVFAADRFIKAAERIGLGLGIEPFIIGVTLVAVGTSLPELITSIVAVTLEDASTDIVLGNVLGSNVTNLCLVLGVVAASTARLDLSFDVLKADLPILMGSAGLLYLSSLDREFSLLEGLIFLGGMATYFGYILKQNKEESAEAMLDPARSAAKESHRAALSWKEPVIIVIAAAGIYVSARFNVEAIIALSRLFGIGEGFIALTAVALGTSLPELVVSIVAVRTKNSEMAVGNILGSNIFNAFAVMGIPRLFGKIEINAEDDISFSMLTMLVASVLVFFMAQDRRLLRWDGYLLLLLYVLFIGNLIGYQMPGNG